MEVYPGQAYFHKHNPNIKATEERATMREKPMSDECRKLAEDIVTFVAQHHYPSGKVAELLASFERKVRLEEAKWWVDQMDKRKEEIEFGISLLQAIAADIQFRAALRAESESK